MILVAFAIGGAALIAAAVAAAAGGTDAAPEPAAVAQSWPATVSALPVPQVRSAAASRLICDLPTMREASAADDDGGMVLAAGGGASLRAAVVSARADCIDLSDPTRIWVVADAARPVPSGWLPPDLVLPETPSIADTRLRAEAAESIDQVHQALLAADVGDIALAAGYADQASAADPGAAEHRTGLAVDVLACVGAGCASAAEIATTSQGSWLIQNAWQYGWITTVAGREAHLRYVGIEIARALHDGGYGSLQQFFALPVSLTPPQGG
ncbi:D-alanyl-D-alanine carboxypeptidase family protein [Microbacterium sp. ZW T5_56]|uniref:D-alanyl-D-alanine carboxypeptidase family protein n=1 Tax=Microbacterium sp. ZW T5_56 TaxID=3378081 RepID=UPI003854123A